jgi:hypothetical protein
MALLAQNTFTLKRLAKDGLSINLGNYSQSVPCNSSGNASAAMTITIPFWGYRGANKVACTCTSPAIGATLVTGVTVSSVTNATESAAGSIVLSVASGATFGASATRSGVFDLVFSVEGETVTLQFGWSKAVAGATGAAGKRVVSGLVYYQLSSSTAPDVPTATAYNFTNNAFTGLTENWALTPPVFEAGNANKFWYAGFYVQETASGGGTGTPAFSSVKQAISFSGLVTFTGDNTVTDGQKTLSFGENGTTEINGGKITTGKVSATRIDVESLAVLEAFVNALIVKSLMTAEDEFGSYIHISKALEEGFYRNFIRFITSSGRFSIESSTDPTGEYSYPQILMSSVLGNNHNSVSIIPGEIQVGWYALSQGFKNWLLTKEGIRCITTVADPAARFESDGIKLSSLSDWANAPVGEFFQDALGRIFRKLYSDASPVAPVIHFGTAITGTSATATIFSSSDIAIAMAGDAYINIDTGGIYKCITGGVPAAATWSYQGKPSYSASEVGALASDAIQYFTAAQWGALTTAQKNAIPLAVVGE